MLSNVMLSPVWLPLAIAAASLSAVAQVSATVDINTTQTTTLNANFGGFNDEVLYSASNQVTNETVFTCVAQAARSCLPVPLSLGGTTDTLYVELYGTGIRGAASVQCFVAGQSVPVLYAGAASGYSGLDQVNVSIPRSLAGAGTVRVYLVADGTASNVVSLAFQ